MLILTFNLKHCFATVHPHRVASRAADSYSFYSLRGWCILKLSWKQQHITHCQVCEGFCKTKLSPAEDQRQVRLNESFWVIEIAGQCLRTSKMKQILKSQEKGKAVFEPVLMHSGIIRRSHIWENEWRKWMSWSEWVQSGRQTQDARRQQGARNSSVP